MFGDVTTRTLVDLCRFDTDIDCVRYFVGVAAFTPGSFGSVLSLLEEYLPFAMTPSLSVVHLFQGFGLGIVVAVIASVYPLYRLLSVSPLFGMRITVQPPPMSMWLRLGMMVLIGGLLCALASWQLQSWELGASLVLGLGVLISFAGHSTIFLAQCIKDQGTFLGSFGTHWLLSVDPAWVCASAMVALGIWHSGYIEHFVDATVFPTN